MRAARGGRASGLDLDPATPAHDEDERGRDRACDSPEPRVAEAPRELGHVLEVHAVDAAPERERKDDGCARGGPVHHPGRPVSYHADVEFERLAEDVAL